MNMKKYAKGGEMTDEERYGKVGAEIRRLDPEAYKNRPRSAEGNLKLLKELRAKAAQAKSRREPDMEDTMPARPAQKLERDTSSPTSVNPTSLRFKPDYSMFDKIRQGGKPAAGYYGMRKGGGVKKYASGGSVSSASKRADGCAMKGKTKGRFI